MLYNILYFYFKQFKANPCIAKSQLKIRITMPFQQPTTCSHLAFATASFM